MPPGLTSPAHLAVVLVVALIVLGPERLPDALRQAGRFVAEVRRWSATLEAQVTDAMQVGLDGDRRGSDADAAPLPPDTAQSQAAPEPSPSPEP